MVDVFQLDYFYCHLVKVPTFNHVIFALLMLVHQKGMLGNPCLWECNMNEEHWLMITAAWDYRMIIISEYVLVSD